MLCDYCKRQCDWIVPIKGFYCGSYRAPAISLSVGDMVWGKLYTYDSNAEKTVPNPQKLRVISLDDKVVRCCSDIGDVVHSFELSEYGQHFFLTEKELLSAYEFDDELR